ncbi:hypothetical protein C8034_v006865 [Colletotrichum sidae]|uniref:Uncharacterized protein n=1 Tax=Colletotrichum sidae TaxID=1347389 RepID=A0A4R8T3M0_9PEZI|nr:hypothetical protein C8034_v006865 [Colletotrichum sidae]
MTKTSAADANGVAPPPFDEPPPPYSGKDPRSRFCSEPSTTSNTAPETAGPSTPSSLDRLPSVIKTQHFMLDDWLGCALVGPDGESICYLHTCCSQKGDAHVCLLPNLGEDAQPIATVRNGYCDCDNKLLRHAAVTLDEAATADKVAMHPLPDAPWALRNAVELVVTVGGRPERFQWRPSRGKEVRAVARRDACGWKLVRTARHDAGAGGIREERATGFASDGAEVVAVIVQPERYTGFTFAFRGSGRTDEMGEAWKLVALMSGLWMWWNDKVEQPLF